MPGNDRINVRFRNEVDDGTFVKASEWILADKRISDPAFRTYLLLRRHAMWKTVCQPDQDTLAKTRGVGARAIQRHIQELVDIGLVTVERKSMRAVNTYFIEMPSTVYANEDGTPREDLGERCWSEFTKDVGCDKQDPEPEGSKAGPIDEGAVDAAVVAFSAGAEARKKAEEKNRQRRMKKETRKAAKKVNAAEASRAANGVNTRGMSAVWKRAYSDHLPGVTPANWGGKERTLLKRLNENYGKDTVNKALVFLCENWKRLRKDWKLSGTPTVEILWGYRSTIFPDIETGGKVGRRAPRMGEGYGITGDDPKGGRDGW